MPGRLSPLFPSHSNGIRILFMECSPFSWDYIIGRRESVFTPTSCHWLSGERCLSSWVFPHWFVFVWLHLFPYVEFFFLKPKMIFHLSEIFKFKFVSNKGYLNPMGKLSSDESKSQYVYVLKTGQHFGMPSDNSAGERHSCSHTGRAFCDCDTALMWWMTCLQAVAWPFISTTTFHFFVSFQHKKIHMDGDKVVYSNRIMGVLPGKGRVFLGP